MASLTDHPNGLAHRPVRRPAPARRRALTAGLLATVLLAATSLPPPSGSSAGEAETRPPLAYRTAPAEAPSDAAASLAVRFGAGVVAEVLHLTADGEDRPLARVEVARLPSGQTHLLGWQSLGTVPVLRRDGSAAEEQDLVEALTRHLPPGSTILAMPQLSTLLSALVEARYPLMGAPEPIVVPAPWRSAVGALAAAETELWGAPASAGLAPGPVTAFFDALLAEDTSGAARLRVMAGTGEAYLVVHLDDAFQIGQLRPGRMEMARQSFVGAGFSHDVVREVRAAAQAGSHAAWTVDRAPDGRLQGYFLTDRAETATLIAQLLPFNSSRLDEVPGLRLVWQSGRYWVYRLSPLDEG